MVSISAARKPRRDLTVLCLKRGCLTEFYRNWLVFVISVLADDTAGKDDLYIRSVCFSPDGKYLATGAEDKQIRVSGE